MSKYNKARTGGRTKGTPNKRTKELRDLFDSVDLNIPSKILELLPKLSPAKQADVLIHLMPYLYPKRKPVDHYPPQAQRGGVFVMIPSNGREVSGQKLYTNQEVEKVKRDK